MSSATAMGYDVVAGSLDTAEGAAYHLATHANGERDGASPG